MAGKSTSDPTAMWKCFWKINKEKTMTPSTLTLLVSIAIGFMFFLLIADK
jgi:hypothetical protein